MATAILDVAIESLSKPCVSIVGLQNGSCGMEAESESCNFYSSPSTTSAAEASFLISDDSSNNTLSSHLSHDIRSDSIGFLCSHGAQLALDGSESAECDSDDDAHIDSVDGAIHSTPLMGQKRKPDGYIQNEEHHNTSLHLYHLTLSKLLSSPPRRIEPSLQRSVVMRNTLKELEYRVFSHTPSKRINLDMDHDLEMAEDDNNEPITASDLQVDTESCGQEPVTQYTELVTASCPSLPGSECENDSDSNKGFSSHLYFSFPALPIITNTNSSKDAHCSDDDDDCFRMESSEDSEDSSSDNSEESMDITSPTQIEESSKLSSFGSYQSLVHCSIDQYRSPSASPSVQKSQHVDELDNIMQVLVTM